MATTVDIANMALDHLLITQKITTIDDATVEARTAKRWIDVVRRLLLVSHPWSWAEKRTTLTQDTDTTHVHPEWQYAFTLPTGHIKSRGFALYRGRGTPPEWYMEFAIKNLPDGSASRIYTDFLPGALDAYVYTFDVADANLPEHFYVAMSYALALKMMRPLAATKEIQKDVKAEWIGAWNDATAHDVTERHVAPQEASWILARL